MATEKKLSPPCTLCEEPVKITGFYLQSSQGKQYFCCQGCLSIYKLLHHNKVPPKQ